MAELISGRDLMLIQAEQVLLNKQQIWGGGVTALSEKCRLRSISGCLSSHGGVAGIDKRDTVFRLKPIFSSSGAMRMPNVGI